MKSEFYSMTRQKIIEASADESAVADLVQSGELIPMPEENQEPFAATVGSVQTFTRLGRVQ